MSIPSTAGGSKRSVCCAFVGLDLEESVSDKNDISLFTKENRRNHSPQKNLTNGAKCLEFERRRKRRINSSASAGSPVVTVRSRKLCQPPFKATCLSSFIAPGTMLRKFIF